MSFEANNIRKLMNIMEGIESNNSILMEALPSFQNIKTNIKAALGNKRAQGAQEKERLARQFKDAWNHWLGQTNKEGNMSDMFDFLKSRAGFNSPDSEQIIKGSNTNGPIIPNRQEPTVTFGNNSQGNNQSSGNNPQNSSSQGNNPQSNSHQGNHSQDNSNQRGSSQGNNPQNSSSQSNSTQGGSSQGNHSQDNSSQENRPVEHWDDLKNSIRNNNPGSDSGSQNQSGSSNDKKDDDSQYTVTMSPLVKAASNIQELANSFFSNRADLTKFDLDSLNNQLKRLYSRAGNSPDLNKQDKEDILDALDSGYTVLINNDIMNSQDQALLIKDLKKKFGMNESRLYEAALSKKSIDKIFDYAAAYAYKNNLIGNAEYASSNGYATSQEPQSNNRSSNGQPSQSQSSNRLDVESGFKTDVVNKALSTGALDRDDVLNLARSSGTSFNRQVDPEDKQKMAAVGWAFLKTLR